jgi:hypothetical protein
MKKTLLAFAMIGVISAITISVYQDQTPQSSDVSDNAQLVEKASSTNPSKIPPNTQIQKNDTSSASRQISIPNQSEMTENEQSSIEVQQLRNNNNPIMTNGIDESVEQTTDLPDEQQLVRIREQRYLLSQQNITQDFTVIEEPEQADVIQEQSTYLSSALISTNRPLSYDDDNDQANNTQIYAEERESPVSKPVPINVVEYEERTID